MARFEGLFDNRFFLSVVVFSVLFIGLVLSPSWMVPTYSYTTQIIALIATVLAISLASFIFYRFSDNGGENSWKAAIKNLKSDKITLQIFIAMIIVFITINIRNLGNGLQNCGDEYSLLYNLFVLKGPWAFLTSLSTATGIISVLSIIALIISIVILILNKNKHKFARILMYSSLAVFFINTLVQELLNNGLRESILQPQAITNTQQSPLVLWLRTPFIFISSMHPDIVLRLVSMILSILTLIVVFLYFYKNYSANTAIIASTIYAFSMLFLISSTLIFLTSTYMLFYVVSICTFIDFLNSGSRFSLGVSIIFYFISLLFKYQALILVPIYLATYALTFIVNFNPRTGSIKLNGHRIRNFWSEIVMILTMIIPYIVLKYAKVHFYDRDISLTGQTIGQLFNLDLVTVYPKSVIEQFTIPIIIIAIIGLIYLIYKKRDNFLKLGIFSIIFTFGILGLDAPYFLGADFGRYAAGLTIVIAGIVGIFLASVIDNIKVEHKQKLMISIIVAIILGGYMIFNAYSPLPYEKMRYNTNLMYTYKYHPFESNDTRFLPSREFSQAMMKYGIRNQDIMYFPYFPIDDYDTIYGLNNTFLRIDSYYFSNTTPQNQNPQTLHDYMKSSNISYVMIPYIPSSDVGSWYYSCIFASLDLGDNPGGIMPAIDDRTNFNMLFYSKNDAGMIFMLQAK